jgi:hypothetical protein
VPLSFLTLVIAALFCLPIDETTLERIPMERQST